MLVAACGIVIAWSARVHSQAQSRLDIRVQQRTQAVAFANKILEHGASKAGEAFESSSSESDQVLACVNEVLAAVALPTGALSGVEPGPERLVGTGTSARIKRTATLRFTGLALPELGLFLRAWKATPSGWTITGLELARPRTQSRTGQRPTAGASEGDPIDRYSCTITLTSIPTPEGPGTPCADDFCLPQ